MELATFGHIQTKPFVMSVRAAPAFVSEWIKYFLKDLEKSGN